MWQIIRRFISLFLTFELLFCTLSGGAGIFGPAGMPEMQTSGTTKYVDPFIGTGGTPWTAGMLSPAAAAPFGMVRLGPDTSAAAGVYLFKTNTSGYYYEHRHILGFSYSRLSGTGIRDYGMFRTAPASGRVSDNGPAAAVYSHTSETASPGYYAVFLPGASALCEMTATAHTGYQRYTFKSGRDALIYIDAASHLNGAETTGAAISVDGENGIVTAEVTINGEFSSRFGGMKAYYYAECDKEIKSSEILKDGSAAVLNLGGIKDEPVTLRAGISFVSAENAKQNLISEAADRDFDEIRADADSLWNNRLSAVEITADENTKKIFYTSLYHTMIMPTDFTDCSGEYIGFDKQTHSAEGFTYRTDMSLWDTCRNVNALYILIADDIQKDCLKSLENMADLGGVLPRWPMGEGYTGSMLGCPANMVFAESYLKGYDFDAEKIYGYMKKSAESFGNAENREYGDLYNTYGYVPDDLVKDGYRGLSVSRTLEYSWADSVIAMFAEKLGHEADAALYSQRAQNYKNVWDDETKYFRARNSDGSWGKLLPYYTAFYDDILGTKFSKAYCEGSARQWRFSITGNPADTVALFGSDEYFVNELEAFMKDASCTRAAVDPGSGYWIGNQHDIHCAYMFNWAGRPDLTQKWVRWTLGNRFSTDINGLDGNDDGGTLSAWYVFSALGFYPVAGTAEYAIGSPNVDGAVIHLSNGACITIKVSNQGKDNIYVGSVYFNGEKLEDMKFSHSMIASGGEFVFSMQSSPA